MNRATFDPGRFGTSYDEFASSYQGHIADLFDAYQNPDYKKLVKAYISTNSALRISKSQRLALPPAVLETSLIDLNKSNATVQAALAFANIGAGCHMLDPRSVPLRNFNHEYSAYLAQTIMDETIKALGKTANRNFVGDNHIADTVRILRFLQITGFLKLDRDKARQLSLGAFTGIRDLNAVHSVQNIAFDSGSRTEVRFRSRLQMARHTVLVDPSDDLKTHYSRLNTNNPDSVLAINETANTAMSVISDKIANGEIQPRNLVISMRIDHRMIPDADDFLKRLQPTITNTADLIMSFGAGDDPDQFLGRIDAFDRMESTLKYRGMSPIRIRMYDDSSDIVNDHRESPLFGVYQFASHEAMYCKLGKRLLS